MSLGDPEGLRSRLKRVGAALTAICDHYEDDPEENYHTTMRELVAEARASLSDKKDKEQNG